MARGESFLARSTMNALAKRLTPECVLRIPRSTLIAVDEVTACRHTGNGAGEALDGVGCAYPVG